MDEKILNFYKERWNKKSFLWLLGIACYLFPKMVRLKNFKMKNAEKALKRELVEEAQKGIYLEKK